MENSFKVLFSKNKVIRIFLLIVFSIVLIIALGLIIHLPFWFYEYNLFKIGDKIGNVENIIKQKNRIIVDDVDGPQKISEITINGFEKPDRQLDINERLIILQGGDYIIYLYFDKNDILFYRDICGS